MMKKRFVYDAGNGFTSFLTAEDLVREAAIDESPAIRLAVLMHTKTLVSDQEFLDIVRPGDGYRPMSAWEVSFDD